MRISATIIVRDEAPIIADCLASVADFDEVIIVDTGSVDGTQDICRGLGYEVHEDFAWCDDFAAARNHAISKATGDWIYSIDADHRLRTPASTVRAEAERVEAAGHKTALVRSVYEGHPGEHWRDVLFKRDPGVRWVGAVHECLSVPATIRVDVTRICSYSINHAADPDRNLRILLAGDTKAPRTQFYLGRECYERRRYDEALDWMARYLRQGRWLPEICEAHLTMARCYWMTGRGNEARAACLEAIRNNPDFKEALLFMATIHHEPWKSKWQRLAGAATNSDVLFIRT